MIIAFLLGILAIPLFIYGGAFVFLLLPFIWVWQHGHLREYWLRIPPETRRKIWQTTLLGSSLLTWVFILKGASA